MRLNFSVFFDMISLNSIGFVWIFIVPSSECLWSWSDGRQEVRNIYMFQIIFLNVAMYFTNREASVNAWAGVLFSFKLTFFSMLHFVPLCFRAFPLLRRFPPALLRPAAPPCSKIRHVKCSEMYRNTNRNHSHLKPLQRSKELHVQVSRWNLFQIDPLPSPLHLSGPQETYLCLIFI
jgi:hypothetical protein